MEIIFLENKEKCANLRITSYIYDILYYIFTIYYIYICKPKLIKNLSLYHSFLNVMTNFTINLLMNIVKN